MNKKNGGKMAESGGDSRENEKPRYSRDNVKYWRERVFQSAHTIDGERHQADEYSVRIQYKRKRHAFALKVANRDTAAKKARDLYLKIVALGWEQTLADQRGEPEPDIRTLGDFFEATRSVSDVADNTFHDYSVALRNITAWIGKVPDPGKAKHDYWNGGRDEWTRKIDAVPLSRLTPEAIQRWKLDYVKTRSKNPETGEYEPDRERRAKNSCNTVIRSAKALFSHRKVLQHLPHDHGIENPFEGIQYFRRSKATYRSKIDAQDLLGSARSELYADRRPGEKDAVYARRLEVYKALVIFTFTGIRRGELDQLAWSQVDLERGILEIKETQWMKLKADNSEGQIPLDPELVEVLRTFRERNPEDVFVMRGNAPRFRKKSYSYRCDATFQHLINWLRDYSPDEDGEYKPLSSVQKPIHELRKEVGAILTTRHGIHAAKQFLRHSDISVTAAFYADQKEKLSLGLRLRD